MSFITINSDRMFNELVKFKRVGEKVLIYNDIENYKPSSPTLLLLQKIPATTTVSQSVLRELFPSVDIRLFDIPTTMQGNDVEKIIDDYVKETGSKEIILDLNSQQLSDYGLKIVSNRPSLNFINMRSTVPSLRGQYENLYFGIESDDFFLPATWRRLRGPTSVQYLIVQSEQNVFVENVVDSVTGTNIIVINENEVQNNSQQLAGATSIFICSLTSNSQRVITNSIPGDFVGNLVFIDSGPLDSDVFANLSKINARAIFTLSQSTSLAHLPANHPWNINLKSTFSNTIPSSVLGLYTVINNVARWKQLLIEPQMVLNTVFGMNSSHSQVITIDR